MTGQNSVISILTNQPGKIRLTGGVEIQVTFSFYRYRETGCGISGRKSAGGCCRVSESSDILTKVFEAGLPVMLTGANVEAEIRLTSPYSFKVVECRQVCESPLVREESADTNSTVIPMPSYRRIGGRAFRWERKGKDGQVEVVIRQILTGAALIRRFRPAH